MAAVAGEVTAEGRTLRECDQCHVVDDKGHHQVVVPGEGGLVMEGRHFECCARAGCPDGSCADIIANRST
jgi:hypothetical protein